MRVACIQGERPLSILLPRLAPYDDDSFVRVLLTVTVTLGLQHSTVRPQVQDPFCV
jgi:hypothetical protein